MDSISRLLSTAHASWFHGLSPVFLPEMTGVDGWRELPRLPILQTPNIASGNAGSEQSFQTQNCRKSGIEISSDWTVF